jgi:hypothetical protein
MSIDDTITVTQGGSDRSRIARRARDGIFIEDSGSAGSPPALAVLPGRRIGRSARQIE